MDWDGHVILKQHIPFKTGNSTLMAKNLGDGLAATIIIEQEYDSYYHSIERSITMQYLHHKKQLAATLVAACLAALSVTAFAEQPKAEEYRALFASGNFYVEYRADFSMITPARGDIFNSKIFIGFAAWDFFKSNTVCLAGENGMRVQSFGSGKKPYSLYQNGKYYRFSFTPHMSDPDKAKPITIMLPESRMGSSLLNPDEHWEAVRTALALPDELAVFYWNDPYRENTFSDQAPRFNGSSKRTVRNKEYDCDQYVIDIKTMAGSIAAQEAYNMLYENGNLVYVQKYFLHDGKEEPVGEIEIKEISSKIPEGKFKIPANTKVYAAGTGNMDDLLERYVEVERIGGENKNEN